VVVITKVSEKKKKKKKGPPAKTYRVARALFSRGRLISEASLPVFQRGWGRIYSAFTAYTDTISTRSRTPGPPHHNHTELAAVPGFSRLAASSAGRSARSVHGFF
jgi:hypothetical protein